MSLDPNFASNKLAGLLMDHATAGVAIVPHGVFSVTELTIVEIHYDKLQNKIFISTARANSEPTKAD